MKYRYSGTLQIISENRNHFRVKHVQYMVQREFFIVLNKYFGHFQADLERNDIKKELAIL
jgi:hypothetical protein